MHHEVYILENHGFIVDSDSDYSTRTFFKSSSTFFGIFLLEMFSYLLSKIIIIMLIMLPDLV